jgi:hypothetical protein
VLLHVHNGVLHCMPGHNNVMAASPAARLPGV